MNSKPRFLKITWLLAVVLLLGTFTNVLAAASGPADRDLMVSAAGGNNAPGGNINIVRATSTNLAAACSPAIAAAFSRDVSSPGSSHAAELATLTLTVSALSAGNVYPLTLKLFGATADISESPVTTTPLATLIGADLNSSVTLNSAPAIGSTITFPTSAQFVAEANAALSGDGRLTVLVEITGCPTGAHTIDFASHESGSGIAQFYFEGPLSVAVSDFATDNAAPTWPLYAGLGALAVLVAVGVTLSRRRATR